jgi:rhodanese-related sulfurtransferase
LAREKGGALSPEELRAWGEAGTPYTLLDVRSPEEVRMVALPGATHVPMGEIPTRLAEIPRTHPVVVICHLGQRSAYVANFLATQGFSDVYDLTGGIDAYAARVDPALPRY